jgi:pimeloyl-ACP methyl ester carboxylesterase
MLRQVRQRQAHSGGLTLNLVDFGGTEEPAILFLHGALGHARVWDFVVEALPPGRMAVALDFPGHGLSGHAADEERYAFGCLVEDVRAVVDVVDVPLVLAGHSLGSAVGQQYAAAYAGTLRGAAFLDIDPCPPARQAEHLNEAGQSPPRRYDAFDRAVAAASRMAPNAAPDVHRHLAAHAFAQEDGHWVQRFDPAFLRSVRTWDTRPLLTAVSVPALVLRGADSTVMSPEGYETMLRLLPDARGELIPAASHQLHLDQPERVAAAIEAFAAALAGG